MNQGPAYTRLRCTARLVDARFVVVALPQFPGRPGTAVVPVHDEPVWRRRLLAQHPTLQGIECALAVGHVILAWQDDERRDDELVRHSAAIVAALLPRRFDEPEAVTALEKGK